MRNVNFCQCKAKLMFGIWLSPRLACIFDEQLEIKALEAGISSSWINKGALVFRDRLKMPSLMLFGYSEDGYEDANVEWLTGENCFVDEYFLGFELAEGPIDKMNFKLKECSSTEDLEKAWNSKISPVLESMNWDHWGPGLVVVPLGSR